MTFSTVITYKTQTGQIKTVGTSSSRINAVTSNLQNQGYTIVKIESQGAGKNVVNPVKTAVPSAQVNKESTTIYEAGTPIGAELVQQTEQPTIEAKTSPPFFNLLSPTERIIYEKSKDAPTPYNAKGRRDWAIHQLVQQDILPEGTGGYYTPEGKEKVTTEYMTSPEFISYTKSPQGSAQLQAIQKSNAEKLLTEPQTLIPAFHVNLFGKKLGWGEVKQPQWMANLNVSTVTVYNPEQAKRDLASNMLWSSKDIYSTLGPRTRFSVSTSEAMLRAASWPITLPQAVVKYLNQGKTLFLPDVSEKLQERTIAPTQGYIEGTIGEVLTGGESSYSETIQTYPVESFGAGFGEIIGLMTGAKALQVTKATTYRGFGYVRTGLQDVTGANIPGYEQISYYFPQRIIRRSWVKSGTKNIDDVMGVPYHAPETLTPGGLSFAPGKTPGARISWTIGKAEESQALTYSEGDIMLGSSGANKVGLRYVINPEVTHELPSLSTTPYGYVPTRFYRFNAADVSYSSSVSLLPKMYAPTGLVTRIQRLYAAPKGTYEEIGEWAIKQPKGKWGVIGPKMAMGGPETEINIFGKTTLKRYLPGEGSLFQRFKGYKYYTDVPLESGKFEVVPVVFANIKQAGYPSGIKLILGSKAVSKANEFLNPFYSSEGISYTPVVSGGYILSKSISGYSKPGSKSYPSYPISPSVTSYPSIPSIPSIPSYPSKPSYPSYPSYPSIPSVPSYPSKPSSPSIPSYPSIPSVPSYPSKPSYPSYPSSPSIPSIPSYPSKPSSPSIPSYPSIPSVPSYPSKPSVPSVPYYPYYPSRKKGHLENMPDINIPLDYLFKHRGFPVVTSLKMFNVRLPKVKF